MKFDKDGVIPMIVQDADSLAVLSLFYGNKESIEKMKKTGFVWRYSRSKNKLMKKGAISGNTMKVISVSEDCDSDALLVKVKPLGSACHTNSYSCFKEEKNILSELIEVISERKKYPKGNSYTSKIVNDRNAIIAKLREELEELIEAKKKSDIKWEAADLLYFILVYLENRNINFSEVLNELKRRRK
ncbi:bifunctional phosphoribosyl-AMP cyclohydrolase/phosphoribosyl-ATP diphosphatase HisIE [Candidatus Micrarchaeota archaeon]|nr:bifunctional phosphoribosyl-AMP cyclohydrolase/phosphoribosyl-ATP diphosphatase HisIE [Candidatus Micrarchaeota archaeon]